MTRAAAVTERNFSSTVEATLRLLGWRWAHFRAARTKDGWRTPMSGDVGFPDIVAVRGKRIVFVELKSDTGAVRAEQRLWLKALEDAGVETYLWRPSDWDEIQETLR